ncbi:hypothetical protein FRC08_013569 [Ceratobasidium sp. 394]|nr:hypothetical protein FRC08_013569 [Ceratobasidium sp. 394]KAG9098969.1 hypothetical protein FS749_002428 [Ceratobasidium sp. UAMH 11750]
MFRYQLTPQTDPDESYPLKSPGLESPQTAVIPRLAEAKPWRSSVTLSAVVLGGHAALGVALCSVAVYFAFHRDYKTLGWFSLYSFGRPLPLLTARYLNFGLDVCARLPSLTLGLLLAFVGLRTATALWSSPQGIKVSDALSFNFIQLDVASMWAAFRAQISWSIRLNFIFSIACGLVVYLSGSLMFGYETLTVPKAENLDIRVGNNQMLLGSNISGSYIPPDYSSLAPSASTISPFTTTALNTLIDIDISQLNKSISSFDLSSESYSSLSSRNITTLLINQTVSTQLTDCQPVPAPATVPFGLSVHNLIVTYVEQNLSSTSGTGLVNQLREELYARVFFFGASRFQTYTFLMTHAVSTGTTPTPADESQVLIVLAYKGKCLPDPFETSFGPMPHARLDILNSTFVHNHAALACRNVRTISRTVYAPDGHQVEQTSHSFYAKPVLSTLNRLYMYSPITSIYAPGQTLAKYGGIGSLLNRDLIYSSTWKIPSCTYTNTSIVPSNSTELISISAAWSQAVARVQHYETSILEAFVKQNTTVVSAPVLVAVPMYQLAVIPGALFVYGLSLVITTCMLVVLLANTGDSRGDPLSAKSLTVLRVATEVGFVREGESEDARVDKSEKTLKRELGMLRIRRRARGIF